MTFLFGLADAYRGGYYDLAWEGVCTHHTSGIFEQTEGFFNGFFLPTIFIKGTL